LRNPKSIGFRNEKAVIYTRKEGGGGGDDEMVTRLRRGHFVNF
jgi:hypothetical protein